MVKQRITLRDVQISVGGNIVGGAEELTFAVARENTVAHEGANEKPAEIVQGAITINGSITRAFIDVDLLNTLCPSTESLWQSFTLVGTIISDKTPGRTCTIHGAVFKGFDVTGLTTADYAKNKLDFDALDWELSA